MGASPVRTTAPPNGDSGSAGGVDIQTRDAAFEAFWAVAWLIAYSYWKNNLSDDGKRNVALAIACVAVIPMTVVLVAQISAPWVYMLFGPAFACGIGLLVDP